MLTLHYKECLGSWKAYQYGQSLRQTGTPDPPFV